MQPDFPRDARIAPILTRIAQLPKKPRLLITIDGPCGSGKSTLADALSDALNAPIIRMDDFFLPHALKTPQRLAIPGGNVDLERLMQEVIIPSPRVSPSSIGATCAARTHSPRRFPCPTRPSRFWKAVTVCCRTSAVMRI